MNVERSLDYASHVEKRATSRLNAQKEKLVKTKKIISKECQDRLANFYRVNTQECLYSLPLKNKREVQRMKSSNET